MPLLNTMLKRLNDRINEAGSPYSQIIFMADVHYRYDSANTGFEKILDQIKSNERDKTLFILIGGDSVDSGSDKNYTAFINRCEKFYKETKPAENKTGIPIIPVIGNHEFYGVQKKNTEIQTYKSYIGSVNFPLDIPVKGLGHSLRVVAFNDAKPRKGEKFSFPDPSNGCASQTQQKHLFYFPYSYIQYSKTAPEKYSGFPDYLKTNAHHIIVAMHVPPRKDPLPTMLDKYIRKRFANCVKKKDVMNKILEYYRNLWMLVHANSTPDKNDSTQWFIDEIKKSNKVELVLMGHVHTYYPFVIPEVSNVQMVISGGGGKGSRPYSDEYPVSLYHYLRIKYDESKKRFVYQKVDVTS
jgi:predicted phosphodiesterase